MKRQKIMEKRSYSEYLHGMKLKELLVDYIHSI